MDRVLNWVPRFDVASREYPARTLVERPVQPRSYTWRTKDHLDQGEEGACVGMGFAHFYASRKEEHPADLALALRIYERAKQVDEWAGADYDGTSVLAGAKAAKEFGLIEEYRWCFSPEEALLHLSKKGALVVGTNWYEGMEDPDKQGYLNVTGQVVGGHCYLVKGLSIAKRHVIMHNSWGPDWGKKGDAYITFDDFARLTGEQGEVCAPLKAAA
jgi:hypothetical protein